MSGLAPPGAVEAASGASLDTSGAVELTEDNRLSSPSIAEAKCIVWPDLSPFEQGYVEAMLREFSDKLTAALAEPLFVGFSDLAPETLATIRKDAENILMLAAHAHLNTAAAGREFWSRRQAGTYDTFIAPPLTVTLGDDGKVRTSPVDDTSDRQSIPGRHSSES